LAAPLYGLNDADDNNDRVDGWGKKGVKVEKQILQEDGNDDKDDNDERNENVQGRHVTRIATGEERFEIKKNTKCK
jgi:hypothetical protein